MRLDPVHVVSWRIAVFEPEAGRAGMLCGRQGVSVVGHVRDIAAAVRASGLPAFAIEGWPGRSFVSGAAIDTALVAYEVELTFQLDVSHLTRWVRVRTMGPSPAETHPPRLARVVRLAAGHINMLQQVMAARGGPPAQPADAIARGLLEVEYTPMPIVVDDRALTFSLAGDPSGAWALWAAFDAYSLGVYGRGVDPKGLRLVALDEVGPFVRRPHGTGQP